MAAPAEISTRQLTARSTGWYPVARSADVGTRPIPVGAGGSAYVVVRLRPGAEVSAFPARCPHRLVPLEAASVVDGTLQCRYHGWRYTSDGRCVDIPALGSGAPPPRADLDVPWAVEERHGWVWLAPERTAAPFPPRPSDATRAEPVPELPVPPGPVLDNLHPSLARAWHPVALSRELRPGGWLQVRLLGRTWSLHRGDDGLAVAAPAFDVGERYGMIWLSPAEPRTGPLEVPEAGDRRFVVRHLTPVRAAGPAGPLLDTLLDEAHVPLVHGAPSGPYEGQDAVVEDHTGFTAVREATAAEPFRTTTVVRTPFCFSRRVEDPTTGASSTAVVVLQPEDADSTRAYGMVLLSAGRGRPLPSLLTVAETVAIEQRRLADDAALQARLRSPGLPLEPRAELHLAADRLGLVLRRALGRFVAS
jgi:phenylpropionate dioxygenase-like ring-hydroxylating dioxygenase large terminal subunit